jgi:hypothetical protein
MTMPPGGMDATASPEISPPLDLGLFEHVVRTKIKNE